MGYTRRLALVVTIFVAAFAWPSDLNAQDAGPQADDSLASVRADADQGKASAQVVLSGHYYNAKDYASSYLWARKAADQGDPLGEVLVAECYANGWGVAQSYDEARRWLFRAADQHFGTAESDLANMFYNGIGTPQNNSEALK